MPTAREQLSGVFAPITTPFRDDRVDEEGLAYNLDKMNRTETRQQKPGAKPDRLFCYSELGDDETRR